MFRYDHIGEKIKLLAKVYFVLGAVTAVIYGFVMLFAGGITTLWGLLLMAGGSFIAWASSWLLYGFGMLVDKADETNPTSAHRQENPQSDRIKQIEQLRLQGLITEEEYQRVLSKTR